MDYVARFFEPFGASEMFISALLGWGIQVSDTARARFLEAISTKADTSSDPSAVRATLAALADAPDLAVTVETYTTAGNADLALFSRARNAILIVEHKTGSSVSRWQITKYRLAMMAADPAGDRKLATVLLRPPTGSTKDEKADPSGVGVSVKLNHNPHLSGVFAAIAKAVDGLRLGDHLTSAAIRYSFPSPMNAGARGADCRSVMLDELEEALPPSGWRVGHRRPLSMDLVHDGLGSHHLYVTIGPHERSVLWGQIQPDGVRLRSRAKEDEPGHLLDLFGGSRSVSFPTPFPVHYTEKPWMRDRPEARTRQVQVAVSMLSRLPYHLETR